MKSLFTRIQSQVMNSFQVDQRGANFMLLMLAFMALNPVVAALLLCLIRYFDKT